MACEVELMEKMAAKYGTYFWWGFEGVVKQFTKQGFPLAEHSIEFLDEVAAFQGSPIGLWNWFGFGSPRVLCNESIDLVPLCGCNFFP